MNCVMDLLVQCPRIVVSSAVPVDFRLTVRYQNDNKLIK